MLILVKLILQIILTIVISSVLLLLTIGGILNLMAYYM